MSSKDGTNEPPETQAWTGMELQPESLGTASTKSGLGSSESLLTGDHGGVHAEDGKDNKRRGAVLPQLRGYEILDEIGRGGMGVVYKARQISLKRVVAIKMVRSGAQAEAEELARFQSEAEAVARLHHPNIVQIYEIGEHDGIWFISLEYLDGGTLGKKASGQSLDEKEAARIVETLARAVHHAHERGIIHRDLKPANVLLDAAGTPKVTDFGLAKQLDLDSGQTRSGAVMGTPSYMPPEQALGKGQEIGPRSDVYALDAVLYDVLAGKPPFKGSSVLETLDLVRTSEPTPPSRLRPGLSRDLETICLKCLAKNPDDRYASALALANDLARFLAGEPILARRESLLARTRRTVRKHLVKILIGLALLITVGLAAYLVRSAGHSGEVSRLETELLTEMEEDWSSPRLQKMEAILAQLEEIAPQAATEARIRMGQRLARYLEVQLRRSVLQDEDISRLKTLIPVLSSKDTAAARELEAELDQRVKRWQTMLRLTPPFEDAARIFPDHAPQVSDGGILFSPRKVGPLPISFTREPSRGNVEMTAVFAAPQWREGGTIGLVLNGDGQRGYLIVLEGLEKTETKGAGRVAQLKILRNGEVLRQQGVPVDLLGNGNLTLRAKREGPQLTCQLNRDTPFTFLDPFPLRPDEVGTFGVVMPASVPMAMLEAQRLTLPPTPGPLDTGDSHFEKGRFGDALALFRKVAVSEGNTPLGQEARFKEAMSLLELKQTDDAIRVLGELSPLPGERWSVLADSHLLILHLERKDLLQAAAIQDRLILRGLKDEHLTGLLPETSRRRLLQPAPRDLTTEFLLKPVEETAWQARRTFGIQRLLVAGQQELINLRLAQGRLYHLDGQLDLAYQTLDENLKGFNTVDAVDWVRLNLSQAAWVLCRQEKATQALAEIDRFLKPSGDPKQDDVARRSLLALRVRVLAAMKQFDLAEKDADRLISLLQGQSKPNELAEVYLLKGFLRLDQGDEPGALIAWRLGRAAAPMKFELVDGNYSHFTNAFILAGICGDMTEDEAKQFRATLLRRLTSGSKTSFLGETVFAIQPVDVFRTMWKRPRGREIARKVAMHDCSYLDFGRLPAHLMFVETLRQLGLSEPVSREQEALLWELTERGHVSYLKGEFKMEYLMSLGLALKGNAFFWPSVRDQLKPELRGHTSYLLGMRYLRLASPKDLKDADRKQRLHQAREFFETASKVAPAGSLLDVEARRELARLKD